jgi:Ca2+-binding EF-hand superfamily protein
MGCESSRKERLDKKIIKESCGLINQTQLDNFYMSYNFSQNEMLTIIDEYKKLCLNPTGLISQENLLDFPPFHYSPFGYHILDALDLNDKDSFDNVDVQNNKLTLKEKNKKDKKEKDKNGEKEEALTNEDLISDIPKLNDDGKTLGVQDFVYYVYLFSSHSKILERAQLYFKLFDFDNDGKITPSDIIVYLENLDRDSDDVLKETKKYFNKQRKINKDDYIIELSDFKSAPEKRQIANLIIKESCSKGKNYIDFFDFRNMYLNMQFIPEYTCPLYLEEKFNDGRVGGGEIKNVEEKKQNETQEIALPVEEIKIENGAEIKEEEENNKININNEEN